MGYARLAICRCVLVLALAAAERVWATETAIDGHWQVDADCGGTPVTITWSIGEDGGTGALTLVDSDCGSYSGGGAQYGCAYNPSPVSGVISGTTLAIPETGTVIRTFTVPLTVYGTCTDPGVDTVRSDLRYDATVVDDGFGTGVLMSGTLTHQTDLLDPNDMVCQSLGLATCSFTARRSDVVTGTNQSTQPIQDATITFTNVASPGFVAITPLNGPAAQIPANFQVANTPVYYNVTTSASISGPIKVCLPYPDADDDGYVDGTTPPIPESSLLLLHEEDGVFVNRTVPDDLPLAPNPDTVNNVICAETEHLSQFVFGAATTTCGDAVVDSGEDCDEGAGLNGASSSCCTASCTYRAGGESCRPSAGECDGTSEACTGSDGACPANAVVSAGTPCTDDGNECRLDQCDGFGACGHPPVTAGTPCTDDGNECRLDECDGAGTCSHPPVALDTPCTPDGSVCTLDSCDGAGHCGQPGPDGVGCDDGDACTVSDECTAGVCGGQDVCDVAVAGLKLIVVDKVAIAGSAKAVYVAKDQAIDKGPGTDVSAIAARLDVAFDAAHGTFVMPGGSNWLVNKPTVAKYVNNGAPIGGAVKVSIIKPGQLVKVVGKSLGDTLLDVSTAPTGPVYVAHTVTNGPDERRHCTQFTGCVHKAIAGGTGYKLVCKGGTGDATCAALLP